MEYVTLNNELNMKKKSEDLKSVSCSAYGNRSWRKRKQR